MTGEWARTVESGKLVYLLEDGTWQRQEASTPPASESADSRGTHFRRASWGDNRATVVASEESDPADEAEFVVAYTQKIAGLDALVFYTFVDDQLVRGKYAITQEHSNSASYLIDRESLLTLLRKKYGEPSSEEVFWTNDLYRDDPSEWGDAVAAGHLSMYSSWSDGRTDLVLGLSGDNYDVNLGIEYSSTALSALEDERDEREALDDL